MYFNNSTGAMTSDFGKRITSTANSTIKAAARLRRKTGRRLAGLMLIEGTREIGIALRSGIAMREAFVCPEIAAGEEEKALLGELERAGITLTAVSGNVFGKLAYRESVGGIVAVAQSPDYPISGLSLDDNPLLLVVDGIEKPGNLGAVLRSADGAGITGLIISDPAAELSNPNVIRASLGTVFNVPCAVTDTAEAIGWLKERDIAIITATPRGKSLYSDVELTVPSAIVVGSEDSGASEEWLGASDMLVSIPMRGNADSLNVSAAATIMMYEAVRQRRRSG
jgi:TrmH family RNA methyltransferase